MIITRLNTREDLERKRVDFQKALAAQRKQILICGGTGCVAGGSLKIYARMQELMNEWGVHCTLQLEEEAYDESIGIKKSGCHGFWDRSFGLSRWDGST